MEGMNNIKKAKNPFYKRWWFIAIAVFVVLSLIIGDDTPDDSTAPVADNSQNDEMAGNEQETIAENENLTEAEFQALDDEVSQWTISQGEVSQKQVEDYIKAKGLSQTDESMLIGRINAGIDYNSQAFHRYNALIEEGKTDEEAKSEMMDDLGYTEANLEYVANQISDNSNTQVSQESYRIIAEALLKEQFADLADIKTQEKEGVTFFTLLPKEDLSVSITAYVANPQNEELSSAWDEMGQGLNYLSKSMSDNGLNNSVMLANPHNTENIVFSTLNGVETYNLKNDLNN